MARRHRPMCIRDSSRSPGGGGAGGGDGGSSGGGGAPTGSHSSRPSSPALDNTKMLADALLAMAQATQTTQLQMLASQEAMALQGQESLRTTNAALASSLQASHDKTLYQSTRDSTILPTLEGTDAKSLYQWKISISYVLLQEAWYVNGTPIMNYESTPPDGHTISKDLAVKVITSVSACSNETKDSLLD